MVTENILKVKLTFFMYDLALHEPHEPKWLPKNVLYLSDTSLALFLKLIVAYVSVFPFDLIFLLDNDP